MKVIGSIYFTLHVCPWFGGKWIVLREDAFLYKVWCVAWKPYYIIFNKIYEWE